MQIKVLPLSHIKETYHNQIGLVINNCLTDNNTKGYVTALMPNNKEITLMSNEIEIKEIN